MVPLLHNNSSMEYRTDVRLGQIPYLFIYLFIYLFSQVIIVITENTVA